MHRISGPPENEGVQPHIVGYAFADGVITFDVVTGRLQVLNGPAGTIWKALAIGLSEAEATDYIADTYAIDHDQAGDDVAQVTNWMFAAWTAPDQVAAIVETPPPKDCGPHETACYDLGGLSVAVIGPPSEVTHHIAVVLSPHRTDREEGTTALHISGHGPFRLRVADRPVRTFDLAEEAIGAMFQAILELKHPDVCWLGILHGASLSLDGHGIVLSAASGSGKSTLTASLAQRGFLYHADDMVALAVPDGMIIPWPAPHSLKRGCWSVLASAFPTLGQQPIHHHNGRDLRVIATDRAAWDHPPVTSSLLVFPRYDETAPSTLTLVTPLEALARLLEDRLFLGHPVTAEAVERFLTWLERVPAYEIVYPDTDTAERMLRGLVTEQARHRHA